MSNDFNLHPHIILAQSLHTHRRPDRLMPRHPLLKPFHHSLDRLVIQRHMIAIHSKHLLPAFSSGIAQTQVDIGESLFDLRLDFRVDDASIWVPAA